MMPPLDLFSIFRRENGHIEVVMPGYKFASDFISVNSRVMVRGGTPTLHGRGRTLMGVWIK